MTLVVQGARLERSTLERLAELSGARAIDPIDDFACRLPAARREGKDAAVAALCAAAGLDWAWVSEDCRLADFGLFVTDMDSTLIDIECIDEIADMQGLKTEVATITAAAMRGEIDFRTSLTRRVALLEGLPETALAAVYEQRLRLNPGAERLLAGLKSAGLRTMLVSGGFTYFTDRLRQRLGFDYAWANRLEIVDGLLTGRMSGDIVDAQAKAAYLDAIRETLALTPAQVICVGDGANDIPMFRAAGLKVAWRAKPALRAESDCCFDHVGLDGILKLFG
ncbi:MAG: phosphoserine phosphatase SerB [Azoarcus sp.]|nr:phosphoserine phosphatase SerB [Azoarcus sp.]